MSEGNREDKKVEEVSLNSRWFKTVKVESGDQEIKEIEDLMKKTPKQYGIYAAIALVIIIILSNL